MNGLHPGEHIEGATRGGETLPATYRAYRSVWCPRCDAPPGQWCRRVSGRPVQDFQPLRTLHQARWDRMAELERMSQ